MDNKQDREPGQKGPATVSFGQAHDGKVVSFGGKPKAKPPLPSHHTAEIVIFPGARHR